MKRVVNQGTSGVWEPRLLGVVAVALVAFGVAAVYAASSIHAVQRGWSGSFFASQQIIGALAGIALLLVVSRIDYHVWQRSAWLLIGVAIPALVVLLLPFARGLTYEAHGARRWLELGPLRFQPSEFAKFAAIVWTAMLAAKKGDTVRRFKRGLLPFLVVLLPIAALILFEPDLSTACLMMLLVGIVLFTAGARIGHFLVLGLVAVPLLWHSIASAQYRLQRMMSFLSPGTELAESSWQIRQSLIGFGSGRLVGLGFGEGMQKLGYLPQAYSDFIYSAIGEEWGFLGAAAILLLYAAFVTLGFRLARTAPDRFGMLLATGLTALIGLTAFIHMGVTLSLVPVTGLPLPFVSHGKSNLLVSLLATGVLVNIGLARQGPGSRR